MHPVNLLLAISVVEVAGADAVRSTSDVRSSIEASQGAHDFDFEFGDWRAHHRVKAANGNRLEFDGVCGDLPLMQGEANVEEHRFDKPTVSHTVPGCARSTRSLASGRSGGWTVAILMALDPPVRGHVENGVGVFYADGTLDGKPVRMRFTWSNVTATSARWQQAYSCDAGGRWDTNWSMEFQRK